MALFKKKVSAGEFGEAVLVSAQGWITSDALRALGWCFEGAHEYDASDGWLPFIESKGVPKAQLVSYLRFVNHCSLHAMALQYEPTRQRGQI